MHGKKSKKSVNFACSPLQLSIFAKHHAGDITLRISAPLFALFAVLLNTHICAVAAPKNIIMVIADGMGPVYPTAYRLYADNPQTSQIEQTVFDRHLVGMASTAPAPVSGLVTDSAAGATALSTGVKSYNGAIAVDVNKQPLLTVLEKAKQQGMKTGIAVTSQIVHATPAAYVVHNAHRSHYNQIADSFFDDRLNGKFKLDVMLGGGWQYFQRPDRDLVAQFTQQGFQYSSNYLQLIQTPKGKPVLGLFADVGLPWALDDSPATRLQVLTQQGIRHLENAQGYFFLIEASQVDWAGHNNDIAAAMGEMHDLANTLAWLEGYVAQHPDTLLVLTADHNTGGVSIGADNKYEWNPAFLRGMQASPETIAKQMMVTADKAKLAETLLGYALTKSEVEQIEQLEANQWQDYYQLLKRQIDVRTNTGWTTGGHTGVDVPVYAMGHSAKLFAGKIENTDIAKTIFTLLQN